MLNCNPALYHYSGYCFNKSRIPDGQLAIREIECEAIEKVAEGEPISTIIKSR